MMREPAGFASLVPEESLRRILSDDRGLTLVCQPIVDLRRGVNTGYEALARFDLPLPVPPDVAFAAASRFGLGEALEALVIERALTLCKQVPPNCFFSINVDPDHLTSPLVFDAIVRHAPLGGVVFELTEQRRPKNIQDVARCLA